jgi:hypothetical protein
MVGEKEKHRYLGSLPADASFSLHGGMNMSLRDDLIKQAVNKKQYEEKIGKTRVKSSAYKAVEYKVPDDKSRDVKEDVVLKECKQYLGKCRGIWWERIEAPIKIVGKGDDKHAAPSPAKGIPDLLLCIQGKLWGVELKRTQGAHLSGEQLSKLLGIQSAGGRSIVVQSAVGLSRALRGELPRDSITTPYGKIDVF